MVFSLVAISGSLGDFSADIYEFYGFGSHTLNGEQISVKSQELNKFWNTVKLSPQRHLPFFLLS
jgi:hypothetical protein